MNKLITISELSKTLNLINSKDKKPKNYILRNWEKEFKQIKPKILSGNRRYYNNDTIELLKKVKYLLKEQGMTINGVKKLLNSSKSLKLDEITNNSISVHNSTIKNKLKNIINLVKELKKLK